MKRTRAVTDDFDKDLRRILVQLIEAREDRNDAERRLHEYRAANTPPERPDEFEGVDAFLDYHHRRQSYENPLRQHERALKGAKKEYTDAADQLRLFLPEGVPLHYVYEGERSGWTGTEYVIARKQGEIIVESPSTATS
jgi:hypothetical protein